MSKATLTIEGFVAQDPTTRDVNGKRVVNVDVAHTPRKKQGDEWVDAGATIWFQAAFWERDADAVLATVTKGDLVTITGQPELNLYTKNDGTPAASVRIKFATLGVIPRVSQQQAPPAQQWHPAGQGVDDPGVPF